MAASTCRCRPPVTPKRRHAVVTGARKKPAKNASGVSLVPTVATELDSDDGSDGVFADGNPRQEDNRQDQWPAAEYFPRQIVGSGGSEGGGRSVDAEEDKEGEGSGGSPSVVGQYVEITSDEDSDGGAIGSGGGSGRKTFEDVESGRYQTRAAAAAAVGAAEGGNEPEEEQGEGDGRGALLAEGGERSTLTRKLRLRLPSKGDMLIYGGFLLNVSTKGTISCFETIGAQYAMTNFSLSSAEVREAGGLAVALNFLVVSFDVLVIGGASGNLRGDRAEGASNSRDFSSQTEVVREQTTSDAFSLDPWNPTGPNPLQHPIVARPNAPHTLHPKKCLAVVLRPAPFSLPAGRSAWWPCSRCGSCAGTTTTSSSSWGGCRS